MGKYDLAINIGKSLVSDAAKWSKACGKPVIATKPTIFHGINPTATYEASGKTFTLNRFCSEEMKEARQMNKIAIRQAKAQGVERTYPKATPQDLKRLTDAGADASASRCIYTSPHCGKEYNLLAEGKTSDGLNILRVLDAEGKYLKTVKIKPKKIIIIDDFTNKTYSDFDGILTPMGHGDKVRVLAQRNNPFAEYEIYDVGKENSRNLDCQGIKDILDGLQKRINKGEPIDYISCSFGTDLDKNYVENALSGFGLKLKDLKIMKGEGGIIETQVLDFANKNAKTRVFMSAGNKGDIGINSELLLGKVEGVGSLSPNGKISNFSSSRNSIYSQHYEVGEYPYTATEYGLSYTGGKSTEIPFSKNVTDKILKYHGKKTNIATSEENEKYYDLYKKYILSKDKEKEQAKVEFENFIEDLKKENKLISKGEIYYEPYNPMELIMSEDRPAEFVIDSTGKLMFADSVYGKAILYKDDEVMKQYLSLDGTSFSTPVRTAKLALNDMMKDVL